MHVPIRRWKYLLVLVNNFIFFFAFDACDKKTRSRAWVIITVFAH